MPLALIPQVCMPLYAALNKIRDERNALSEEFKHAAPGERPAIAHQIQRLLPRLEAAQVAFEHCVKSNPNRVAIWPVTVTVTFKAFGVVTHTTGTDTLALEFDRTGSNFQISAFPDLKLQTVHVQSFSDAITVSRTHASTGTFNKLTGVAGVDADFTVSHSVLGATDSSLSLHFNTGIIPSPLGDVQGSPMDQAGNLTLVAAGTLVGGSIGGNPVTVTMTGKVSPHPRPSHHSHRPLPVAPTIPGRTVAPSPRI